MIPTETGKGWTEEERRIISEAVAHVLMNGGLFCWKKWTYK